MNSLWADSHIRFHFAGTEPKPGRSGSPTEQAGRGEVDSIPASPLSKERIDFEMRLIHHGCAEYNGDEGGAE